MDDLSSGLVYNNPINNLSFCLAWCGWQIVNCDVVQGDGLVVNLGSGNAIVVDVGPEPEKMDQCLRKLGI